MNETDRIIRERFQISRNDTLPYTGKNKTTRNDLAKLFAELKFTSGAEIGVCNRGRFYSEETRAKISASLKGNANARRLQGAEALQ